MEPLSMDPSSGRIVNKHFPRLAPLKMNSLIDSFVCHSYMDKVLKNQH